MENQDGCFTLLVQWELPPLSTTAWLAWPRCSEFRRRGVLVDGAATTFPTHDITRLEKFSSQWHAANISLGPK
jgi:hypothetical protein